LVSAAGFLLGFPVLRLRGDYLAIVTSFGEIVRILLLNNTEVTGGLNGISQIPKPTSSVWSSAVPPAKVAGILSATSLV
jgi:branched-chain amino acid transport system permease protein